MGRSLSLRARLILGVIALAAVGLVAADVATYSALSSFLIKRTDTSLQAAHVAVEGALFHDSGDGPPDHGRPGQGPASETPDRGSLTAAAPGDTIQVRRLDGHVLLTGSVPRFPGSKTLPGPALPASISVPAGTGERVAYFTVAGEERRWPVPRAGLDRARDEELPPRRRDPSDRRRQHVASVAAHRSARDGPRARRNRRCSVSGWFASG